MKKITFMRRIAFLLTCVMILTSIAIGSVDKVFGAETDFLIEIDGKRVTSEMSVEDVEQLFSYEAPVIKTESVFGGYAYTFYKNDYSDYLYLETNDNGEIVCYGTVSRDFKTPDYSYGDKVEGIGRFGTEATDNETQELLAVVYYSDEYTYSGDAQEVYNSFFEQADKYNRGLCMHATEMFNAVQFMEGYEERLVFNEAAFELNQQLADNYSDLWDYCFNTGQVNYFSLINWSRGIFEYDYSCPNPLQFARYAYDYNVHDGYYPAFIWRECNDASDGAYLVGSISPDFFVEKTVVEYTDEEKQLLASAREYYAQSVELYNNNADHIYEIEPQYEELPLIAGKANVNIVNASISYLNSIRVGAGLYPVTYSEVMTEGAQYKATLTQYMNVKGIYTPDPHMPERPEGVDEEFFNKSEFGASGESGENLFSGSFITSISNAISEVYNSNTYSCGHRHNLLSPNITKIGIGLAGSGLFGGQACHKVGGYISSNVEVVGWPSKGVTPIESGIKGSEVLSCCFYNGLKVTDETCVTVQCLNTGSFWIIDPSDLSEWQGIKKVNDYQISYLDGQITFTPGNVYSITFSGLEDEEGNTTTYSYRSIIENVYTGEDFVAVPEEMVLSQSETSVCKGKTKKIKAIIKPTDAINKMVTWKSDDESIATVSGSGVITGKEFGDCKITATTSNGISQTVDVHVTEHDYSGPYQVVKKATCIAEGIGGHKCIICGDVENNVIPIDETNHKWDSGKVIKEPTASETGKTKYTCTLDSSHTKIESIPKLISLESASVWNIWDEEYSGNAIRQDPVVLIGEEMLEEDVDYTISYKNNVNVGLASIVFTGKGIYTGSVTEHFRIQFKDVTDDSLFYYEPIYWAVDKKITTGWADGTFRPMNTCNRAAVVTFLWRLAGKPEPKAMAKFKDMTGNRDFDKAISWAAEKGITTGWEDNTFRPWNTCNRAAIVTFLWRYAGRPTVSSTARFKDMTGNRDFDKAITWAASKGITTGWSDNTFRPWDTCKRLAIVSFLYRYNK